MPSAIIRANRTEVSERFPMLGFTVRTGAQPYFETVLTTDPGLLDTGQRSKRTPSSFWSSRAIGPLPAERGEAVFIVPEEVLTRFAGTNRLYYAVATFADRARQNPQVAAFPPDATPFVTLATNYVGRRARPRVGGRSGGVRWNGKTTGGYGDDKAALEWAGDAAQPGTEQPVTAAAPAAPGGAPAASAALEYHDGYDPSLWHAATQSGDRGRLIRTRASAAQCFDVNWADVPLIPNTPDRSERVAAAAMVAAWRDRPPLAADADGPESSFWAPTRAGQQSDRIEALAATWMLETGGGEPYTVERLRALVESNGPLWVSAAGSPHAVVITGLYGDGTPEATYIRINDPTRWQAGMRSAAQAAQYVLTYRQFMDEWQAGGPAADLQTLHVRGEQMRGRIAAVSSQSSAFAESTRITPRTAALAVPALVPIAATILGTTMTRILNNEGDVSWELDQLQGLKHPGDDAARATGAAYTTTVTRVAGWPVIESGIGDQIYADFEIEWQHNGHSLGNVAIKNIHANDAIGQGLEVKTTINNDATIYAGDAAGIRVSFNYRFTNPIASDVIAIRDYVLKADGQIAENSRWTQKASGWFTSEEQGLASAQGVGGEIVKEIASPIVETLLKLITDSLGSDLSWTVPKLDGLKHVGDDPANRGADMQTHTTDLKLPRREIGFGVTDEIYLDFRITWQSDGRSLGNVKLRRSSSSDAIGWALDVTGELLNDAATYGSGATSYAGIKLLFTSTFTGPMDQTKIALTDVTLFGNGTVRVDAQWTQD